MRTPAGKECKHYHEDFHRGRNVQVCRLVQANTDSARWHPKDCGNCPVPDILNANASPNMELMLTIVPTLLGFRRKMDVEAYCTKHRREIKDPYVGCEICNAERPGLDLFRDALG